MREAVRRATLTVPDPDGARMEWVGLITWLVVVMLALPVAAGGLVSPALAVQPLLVMAGLAACVLYIVLDGGRWLAWLSCGLALAAAVALAAGAARLLSDESPASAGAEHAALPAGVEATLLPAVAFAMLLAAAGITTID